MADFPDVVDVATMDAATGSTVQGLAAGDRLGTAVAGGDINGDGYGDLIVGADGDGDRGAVYVVFGSAAGLPGGVDLAALDGLNGFKVVGGQLDARFGATATAADLNNDGYDELIIGAWRDGGAGYTGSVTVVWGKADGFAAALDVSVAAEGVSSILTGLAGDRLGSRLSAIGDYNGDGYGDFLVAAPFSDRDGVEFAGAAYVVLGAAGGLPTNFSVADLDGTNGFEIYAPRNVSGSPPVLGSQVAGVGDVNDDGFDDFLVSAPTADPPNRTSSFVDGGMVHLFLGQAADEAARTPTADDDMFLFGGMFVNTGSSLAAAGDFNGDGLADIIATQPGNGRAIIVYGSRTLPGAIGALTAGTAPAGTFTIQTDPNAQVFAGGDVNGDGFGDLLITNGQSYGGAGVLYVVFGGAALSGEVALADLVPSRGFRIEGAAGGTNFGGTARSVGDLNGDGADELVIGASNADGGGADAGAVTIIWGRPSAVTFTGGSGDDVRNGGAFGDVLSGNGGRDTLNGLGADDTLNGGDMGDTLNGGDGADQLFGGNGGDVLNGEDGDDVLDGGDGGDKLNGGIGLDALSGGVGADRFDGGAGDDGLTGGDGNDYLDGGAEADAMTGGAGNDVYLVDHFQDATIEAEAAGYDIVRTAQDGWQLADNVEGLELQGAGAIDGIGNDLANNIQGNSGDNRLYGQGGVDTINGGDGDDSIVGGLGGDLLRGGLGADTFWVSHIFAAGLETDIVYDFSAAEGDLINLQGIDAIAGGADDAFTLVSGFSKAAGQMTLTFAGGQTLLRLDVTGDGKADYQMKINGDVTGDVGGWVL